jgi:hypothetical protein
LRKLAAPARWLASGMVPESLRLVAIAVCCRYFCN